MDAAKIKFGQLAISMGFVSHNQLNECLKIQGNLPQLNYKKLGLIMMEKGYLSQNQILGILSNQNESEDESEDDIEIDEIDEMDEIDEIEDSSLEISSEDIDSECAIVADEEVEDALALDEGNLTEGKDANFDSDIIEDGIPIDLGYNQSDESQILSEISDENSSDQNVFVADVDDSSDMEDAVVLDTENQEVFNSVSINDEADDFFSENTENEIDNINNFSGNAFEMDGNSFGGNEQPLNIGDNDQPFDINSSQNPLEMDNNLFGGNEQPLNIGDNDQPFDINSSQNPLEMDNNPFDNNEEDFDINSSGNAFEMESNPFGSNSQPFDIDSSGTQNPFGNQSAQNQDDLFGNQSAQNQDDLFGNQSAQNQDDLFGNQSAQNQDDPFNSTNPFESNNSFGNEDDISENPFSSSENPFDMGDNPFGNDQTFNMNSDNNLQPNSNNPFDNNLNDQTLGDPVVSPFPQNSNDMFSQDNGDDVFFTSNNSNSGSFDFFDAPNSNMVSPEEDATIAEEEEGSVNLFSQPNSEEEGVDLFSQSSIDKITAGEDITLDDNNMFTDSPMGGNLGFPISPENVNQQKKPIDPFSQNDNPFGDENGLPLDLESSGNMEAKDTYGIQPIGDAINLENSINSNDFDPFSASDPTISYENIMLNSEPNAKTQEWDWQNLNNQQNFPSNTDIESDFFNPPDLQSNIRPPQPQNNFGQDATPSNFNNPPGFDLPNNNQPGFDLPNISTDDATIAAPLNPNINNPQVFGDNIGTFPPTASPFPQSQPPTNKFEPPKPKRASGQSKRPAPPSKRISKLQPRSSRSSRYIKNKKENSLSSNEIKILYAILIFCMVVLIAVVVYVVFSNNKNTKVGEALEEKTLIKNETALNLEEVKEDNFPKKKYDLDVLYREALTYMKDGDVQDDISNQDNRIDEALVQKGIEKLNTIISIDASYEEALFHRAKCHFVKNNYYDAQVDAQKSLETTQKKTECRYILAVCAKQKNDYDKALFLCNQILNEEPTFFKVKALKTIILKEKGELLPALKVAIELKADGYPIADGAIQSARLAIVERLKTPESLNFTLEDVMSVDKNYPPFFLQMALKKLEEGSIEAAHDNLKEYMDSSKTNISTVLSNKDLIIRDLYFYMKYELFLQQKNAKNLQKLQKFIMSSINKQDYYVFLPPLSIGIITNIKILYANSLSDQNKQQKAYRDATYYYFLAQKSAQYLPQYKESIDAQLLQVTNQILLKMYEDLNQKLGDKLSQYIPNPQAFKYLRNYYTIEVLVWQVAPNSILRSNDVIVSVGNDFVFTSLDFYQFVMDPNRGDQTIHYMRNGSAQQIQQSKVDGLSIRHKINLMR